MGDDNCYSPVVSVAGELPMNTVSQMDAEASALAGRFADRCSDFDVRLGSFAQLC